MFCEVLHGLRTVDSLPHWLMKQHLMLTAVSLYTGASLTMRHQGKSGQTLSTGSSYDHGEPL